MKCWFPTAVLTVFPSFTSCDLHTSGRNKAACSPTLPAVLPQSAGPALRSASHVQCLGIFVTLRPGIALFGCNDAAMFHEFSMTSLIWRSLHLSCGAPRTHENDQNDDDDNGLGSRKAYISVAEAAIAFEGALACWITMTLWILFKHNRRFSYSYCKYKVSAWSPYHPAKQQDPPEHFAVLSSLSAVRVLECIMACQTEAKCTIQVHYCPVSRVSTLIPILQS